jgi:hypothetical protein
MPLMLTAERIVRDEERKKAEIKIKQVESKRKAAESKIRKAAESKIKKAESKIKTMVKLLLKAGYDKVKIKTETGLSDRELNRLLPQT